MMWSTRINFIAGLLLILTGISAQAQMSLAFSADVSVTSGQGNAVVGKWYLSPPKMRMDMTSPVEAKANPMGKVSMIIDPGAKNAIMLMPQHQVYMEIPAGSSHQIEGMQRLRNVSQGGNPCAGETGTTCKKLGSETVNGRSCDKWEITEKEEGHTTIAWVDQKLHFPIKVQDNKGVTTNFTNIKEGPQDPSLFVIPPGYHKLDVSAPARPR